MFEIRLHGRGGQGVVTAAELLSIAAFYEGKESQAFPSFGSERMGAPVMAFCRIADRPIRTREPVTTPNVILVQDPTLLASPDFFSGLSEKGFVLINSGRPVEELGLSIVSKLPPDHVCALPASEIARKHLGRPVPNAALLGGFVGMCGVVSLSSLQRAIAAKFSGDIGAKNAAAAQEAFDAMRQRVHREEQSCCTR